MNLSNRWATVVGMLVALAAFSGGFATYSVLQHQYDPLRPYTQVGEQDVLSPEVEGIPTVYAFGDGPHSVPVRGLKCVDERTTVTGVLYFQAVEPPGSLVRVGEGEREREAGCENVKFDNDIPDRVLAITRRQPGGRMLWRVSGSETPVRSDGLTGVTRSFRSEVFAIETQ